MSTSQAYALSLHLYVAVPLACILAREVGNKMLAKVAIKHLLLLHMM